MKRKKTCGLICAALVLAVLPAGCQVGNRDVVVMSTMSSRQVFQIGGRECSLKEARVYLCNYANLYGTAYTIDLWQHDFGEYSLEDYVKDITLSELTRVYCMDLLAESREMSLSEEELQKTAEAVGEYYASLTRDEISYMEVSEADIREYYEHYALAQKLYNSLTGEVNEEVSDDEARVMEIMQIYVSDQAKAMHVQQKLEAGDDFAAVAGNYNELSAIQISVARDDLPKEVEEIAFQLDDNEISDRIEVENGYYFIKCLNKYDVEQTEANKSNIVEKREKEAFDDVYHAFTAGLNSYLNEETWNEVRLDAGEEIATTGFFEVYEKYCSGI